MSDHSVAETVIQQLGGANRLRAMLGKKLVLIAGKFPLPQHRYAPGLTMRWARRTVQITLDYDDLYDVMIKVPGRDEDWYYDVEVGQLRSLIEGETGYRLSL
jgi:hypothetical protein